IGAPGDTAHDGPTSDRLDRHLAPAIAIAARDTFELDPVEGWLVLERDIDEVADPAASLAPAVGADLENELGNVQGLDDRTAELRVGAPVGQETAEAREAARLAERVADAVSRVMQEPRESSALTESAKRGLRVPPGKVDQRRSQRRRRLDETRNEPADDRGFDVPAQHREHRKLEKRALRDDRDVDVGSRRAEGAPSLHAHLDELLPRLVAPGRGGRDERVRHLALVDPAGEDPAAGEQAREELSRRRLARAGESFDQDQSSHWRILSGNPTAVRRWLVSRRCARARRR